MSLKPQGLEPIPELTQRLARASFPHGSLPMRLRDALGTVYQDEAFAHLFPKRGRAAEAAWRLALVLVLQALENLTDRQAADAVRGRLDWKYALSLPVDDPGFDHSILSDFRARLVSHEAVQLVLEPILTLCRAKGWVAPGGQYRTDSTHVLSAVRRLSSLESVGETLRAVLNAACEVEPERVRQTVPESWFDRYVHRFELARFPRSPKAMEELVKQVGQDGWSLLQALQSSAAPPGCESSPWCRCCKPSGSSILRWWRGPCSGATARRSAQLSGWSPLTTWTPVVVASARWTGLASKAT